MSGILTKRYKTIKHIPGSNTGPTDKTIDQAHADIPLLGRGGKKNRKFYIIAEEKLDGTNVGAIKKNDIVIPICRTGHSARTSKYLMHHDFHDWVMKNYERFHTVLNEGERIQGEWLGDAHGIQYDLPHEPFVTFDIFDKHGNRLLYRDFVNRVNNCFVKPTVLNNVDLGNPITVEHCLIKLGYGGFHGARDGAEGIVWRVESGGKHEMICKYVRKGFQPGKYLGLEHRVLNNFKLER